MIRGANEIQPAFMHGTIRPPNREMEGLKVTELVFKQDFALFNWVVDRLRAMGIGDFKHVVIDTDRAVKANPIFTERMQEDKFSLIEREGADEEWQSVWQVMTAAKNAMRDLVLGDNWSTRIGRDLESDSWIAQNQAALRQRSERDGMDWEMDAWIAGSGQSIQK